MTIKVTYNITDVYVTQDVSPVYINVSYSSGGGSGAAVWGIITGTISNQTDLQTALDGKVPYTGATANVDLGEYELKAGQVEFDQTPTGTAGVGVMRWNDSDGTVDLGLKGGNVTLQVGQEQVTRVVNKSGVNLLESAYQVVKVTDAQGQRLAVDLAQGNNDANSADTLGIVTENIDNNQEGFITTSGIVRNINTTGSLQGETWNDGDVLYLSPTTAGAITNIKPTAPNHTVILGYVVYAHAVNGKIFVKCDNGYELGELHDVYVPTPSNNDGIFWNSTNLRYENKSVSSALGYTPANSATTLTINGVTYDLSTSRTYSVGTVTSVSAITIGTSGTDITSSVANGTTTPVITLNIPTASATNRGALSSTDWSTFNAKQGALTLTTTGTSGAATLIGTTLNIPQYSAGGGMAIGGSITSATTGSVLFVGSGGVLAQNNANFFWDNSNSRLILGSTTNTGERLQVTGNVKVVGSGATSATTALTVQNSSSTNLLFVRNDGRVGINTNNPEVTFDVRGADAGIFLFRNAPEEAFINIKTGTTASSTGVELRGLSNQKGFRFCDSTNANNNYMQLWSSGNLTLETNTRASYSDVASALLQVNSTTKGFLPPRMTTTQKNAISSPAAGLVVYDTTDNKHYGYNGTTWNAFY